MNYKNVFQTLVETVLYPGVKKATKYLSPRDVIKATYFGKRRKGSRVDVVVVTAGRPNYEEREFIRKAKLQGKRFPIKDIILK